MYVWDEASSLKRRKRKGKRTKAGVNLVIMLLSRYLECVARVDTQEKTKRKERKKRKKEGRQSVVFTGNER